MFMTDQISVAILAQTFGIWRAIACSPTCTHQPVAEQSRARQLNMAHGTAAGKRALDVSLLGDTLDDRVAADATVINSMLAQYDEGQVQTGIRTSQADVLSLIAEATLSEQPYIDVGKAGGPSRQGNNA